MNLLKVIRNPKFQIPFIAGCGGLLYYNNMNSKNGSLISNYRQLSVVKHDKSPSAIEVYNKHPFETNVETEKWNAHQILKLNQDENSTSSNNKTHTIAATEKKPKYAINVKTKDVQKNPKKLKKSHNVSQKDIDLTMDCIRKSQMNSETLRSCVQNKFGKNWNVSIATGDKEVSDGYITYKNGYMQFVSNNKEITIWNTQT
mmetsp:Transcript_75792/g.67965  ORF Transcript_75792/g.67965 Transcript_75792/m.67965 type:complete len:201 (-) Transcript_75792:34-636(-)